jgi:GNAT superfamily N-acetyltransferase
MKVEHATKADLHEWLVLAEEVEYLFGPLVNEPGFIQTLERNISEGRAFCMREHEGLAGSPLQGGVLISTKDAPKYKVGWLAVSSQARNKGVATALLQYVLQQINTPAEISVITFGEDVPDGKPARELYKKFGFVPQEQIFPNGPEGGSRQLLLRSC